MLFQIPWKVYHNLPLCGWSWPSGRSMTGILYLFNKMPMEFFKKQATVELATYSTEMVEMQLVWSRSLTCTPHSVKDKEFCFSWQWDCYQELYSSSPHDPQAPQHAFLSLCEGSNCCGICAFHSHPWHHQSNS